MKTVVGAVDSQKETIGDHQSIDILADLPQSYNNNEDFAAYAAQEKAHSEGKPVGYSAEDWKLDRFKFLPMVDKAYQMRPHADWYVFIEADVYYFCEHITWDRRRLAARDGMFLAYRGAGFVLSRGLMKRLIKDSTQLSVRYQSYAENDCCGDAALGYAIMNQTSVPLQALYPTFDGDELVGLKMNRERCDLQHAFTHSTILDYILPDLH
ncbi:putative glycosyltransferase family 31 [Diaporthe ampelina]|uniref:Putative glycosyltransferase family 31 n=1 Tax=Diaporthe ampelina TaxID=1214573 RepID=A0A0G2FQP8_9PEZI|nr:putative glycosyltransferase family 31 [Diaporthe ampelina]